VAFTMSGDVNRDVTITFIGRDQASSSMRSISSSATRTTSIASKLGTALKAVGIAAATALAAGAAIAAKALFDATKAAYYDQIAMKKLAYTQRQAQDATNGQVASTKVLIDSLELVTGVADDELRPAMAALASTGMAVRKSQYLLQLALDISASKGKALQSVSEALSKAYNGQLTGLSRLGIKVTDAKDKALSFSEVLDVLQDRFGGAAQAAGKTDPLARLSAAWHQMQEEVGAGLLPVLRKFTEWMINTAVPWIKDELVPAVKEFGKWIKRNQSTLETWGRWLQFVWSIIVQVTKAIATAVRWVSRMFASVKQLFGLDTSWLEDLKFAVQVLSDPMRVINEMMSTFGRMVQLAALMVEALISKIGQLGAAFTSLPTGAAGWVLDKIGASADGGFLPRAQGGWTMVGEHGPELINNRGFVKTHSQSMGAGGGTINITVNGALDPVMTARQIERVLAKGRRTTGVGGLATA
jgi:hypothetical protein